MPETHDGGRIAQQQQLDGSPSTSIIISSPKGIFLALVVGVAAAILAFFFTPLRSAVSTLPSPLRRSLSTPIPRAATAAATTTKEAAATAGMKLTHRPSATRGHADHDWLYTYHTFSFASWYSPAPLHNSFGPLRVINEDRVKPATGFGAHSHAEFLIFSYVVGGTLEHRDSMGNLENLTRGEVQFTSAGTGIRHSEFNRDADDEVHFLQIWARPDVRGLKPHYETKKFRDEDKADRLLRIMESNARLGEKTASSPIGLQADLSMDASILAPGKKVVHELVAEGPRKLLLQVIMNGRKTPREGGARIKVGHVVVAEGDGVYVEGMKGPAKLEVESVGHRPAEFLLFDLGMDDA